MSKTRLTIALALALTVLGTGAPGLAQDAPRAGSARGQGVPSASMPTEVLVVLAREDEGRMDPALADIAALRRPPFNAFHSMEVLSRSQAHLSADQPLEVRLPNGRQLRVELDRATEDGRHRVRVSINTPGQTDYLRHVEIVASPGEPFFFAGQNWDGGTLVIGIRIGQRPASR